MRGYTISEIEALQENELIKMVKQGTAELIVIKGHNCYFTTLADGFGYSVLIYKNNHHLYSANDYQLYHSNRQLSELKELYVESLYRKLFTDSELSQDVKSYDEYTLKDRYLRNYWIMQYDHISIFRMSDDDIEKVKEMYFNPICFCYVSDKSIVDQAMKDSTNLEESFKQIRNNADVFRKMISQELSNHEAGYTCDYTNTLEALNLKFDELTPDQQEIVNHELQKQINECY